MRVLIQRVTEASVAVEGVPVGAVAKGMLVLCGAAADDTEADIEWVSRKMVHLRIFADEDGRFNRSVLDIGGAILLVSQFTLFADCRKGRRPDFLGAAPGPQARETLDRLKAALEKHGIHVETGTFGAMMQVKLINDGPVTIWLDSRER